jgi:hypothetical protein
MLKCGGFWFFETQILHFQNRGARPMTLVEYENRLLDQLLNNRKTVAVNYIPADLKDEFVDSIYTYQVLSEIVKDIYYNSRIKKGHKKMFLNQAISASMFTDKFWRRLILEKVNPGSVTKKMMENTRIF